MHVGEALGQFEQPVCTHLRDGEYAYLRELGLDFAVDIKVLDGSLDVFFKRRVVVAGRASPALGRTCRDYKERSDASDQGHPALVAGQRPAQSLAEPSVTIHTHTHAHANTLIPSGLEI